MLQVRGRPCANTPPLTPDQGRSIQCPCLTMPQLRTSGQRLIGKARRSAGRGVERVTKTDTAYFPQSDPNAQPGVLIAWLLKSLAERLEACSFYILATTRRVAIRTTCLVGPAKEMRRNDRKEAAASAVKTTTKLSCLKRTFQKFGAFWPLERHAIRSQRYSAYGLRRSGKSSLDVIGSGWLRLLKPIYRQKRPEYARCRVC